MQKFKKALDRAKVKLMTQPNSVFISTILFSLKLVIIKEANSVEIPTAGTDGISLYINEPYFLELTEDQRVGLLFHEAWHVAWNHMARGADLEKERYNIAGDHVINLMALAANYILPPNGYHDAKFKNKSTKQVYDLLPSDKCSKKGGGGIGLDIIFDSPGMSEAEKDKKLVDLTNTLVKATVASKLGKDAPGTIPGEIQVMIDDLINPKLPWQVLLQNYMTAYAKEDFTWARPNRRYMPDFYLPSAHSEAVGHIAVSVDTSCSVSDAEFTAFRSEIQGIKEHLNPELLTVIDFDTSIKQVRTLAKDEDFIKMKFSGRGGTNINPVWKWTKKNKPMVMIIFSDMEFTFPKVAPDTDVLWICINNPSITMPYGDTVHFNT